LSIAALLKFSTAAAIIPNSSAWPSAGTSRSVSPAANFRIALVMPEIGLAMAR
jgi:hypothetical protein